ncbi:retrotransposon protein, putative, ty3-gypsy subclass [Tanacetum coccineum]
MPLDDHVAHWINLIGEIVRKFPMHYPSWHKIESDKKAETHFDLTPDMQSKLWPKISKGIEQHLAKVYTDNTSSLKKEHWVDFWLDPKNTARAAQNAQNQAKIKVVCRQGSRSLFVLQDMQMKSSETREYPSLIQTYYDTHIVDGVWLQDEARLQYEEMMRLKDLGPNTSTGVPYTEDQIMAMVRKGKQRGTFPVLVGFWRDMVVRSDDRMSQQSQNEVGSSSGSGRGGDDESGENEDAGEDEDVDGSSRSECCSEVSIGSGYTLTRISGTFGQYDDLTVITSLYFRVGKNKVYGSYGRPCGTAFSLPVVQGKFTGFFGDSGDYLDKLGAILAPAPTHN